ncbi:amidohydrolase family protein [Halomonas sp. V046]|uniref:amidohydrolase family protein n=1 Tax=Halomonas sp. V046 TaxID=3459611 RepID=UPI0040440817
MDCATSRSLAVRLLLVGTLTPLAAAADDITVSLDSVTNLAATLSADGKTIVFDAQGVLWKVPSSGGKAQQLSDLTLGAARPDYSPGGDLIAVQSYREGTFDIWTLKPDGSELTQWTEGPWDEREPTISPDGQHIAFVSDRSGSYDVWSLALASGELTQWTDSPGQEAYPTWSPDGAEIAYVVDGKRIDAVSATAESRVLIDAIDGTAYSPSWRAATGTGDGDTDAASNISWVRLRPGQTDLMLGAEVALSGHDVFPFRAQWQADGTALITADGGLQRWTPGSDALMPVPFSAELSFPRQDTAPRGRDFDSRAPRPVKGIVTPALAPDGTRIAFAALNDLWLMPLGEEPHRLTDDTYYESDPAWSRDGSRLAYISDSAGSLDVWVLDLESGLKTRLTTDDGAELYPAWSPDGATLAYQTELGETRLVDVASGQTRPLVEALFQPGRASWSADGRYLALAAVSPYTSRFREGTSQILMVEVATGDQRFIPVAEHKSITIRADAGPIWSPDGRHLAFVMDGYLHTLAVDPDGSPTGEPVAVTEALADSPTWSGDSRKLAYLNNGTLEILDLAAGTSTPVPLTLNWRPEAPRTAIVHAGRLWDGASPTVRENMDLIVANGRLVRIEPHDETNHAGNVIDAADGTVIPGLIEAHTHQSWGNHTFGFGARQGRLLLSMGITTTRSVGELAYRAVADREALASGERVGPRYFTAGGPLDGARIYYNAMRPVADERQLDLELARASALDLDVLKTYVRLKPAFMERVARYGNRHGLPTYSHFLAPGIYLGQDGTTHLGATERLDYSRISSLTGKTYDDVIDLFSAGEKSVISTFFITEPSLFDASAITEDNRVQTLLPVNERRKLADARDNPPNADGSTYLAGILDNPATFAAILRGGGRVLAGTDSPLDYVGIGLHSNLRWLASQGGLSPFDTLRTTTSLAAQELGVGDDLGTLEVGKLADMVIVDGRPDESVNDLIDVQSVIKGGRLYRIDDLLAPFAR